MGGDHRPGQRCQVRDGYYGNRGPKGRRENSELAEFHLGAICVKLHPCSLIRNEHPIRAIQPFNAFPMIFTSPWFRLHTNTNITLILTVLIILHISAEPDCSVSYYCLSEPCSKSGTYSTYTVRLPYTEIQLKPDWSEGGSHEQHLEDRRSDCSSDTQGYITALVLAYRLSFLR